jgi:hypothetical protein
VRTSQHPGSPGWPQQLLRVRSLVQLFTTILCTLRLKGMGARRLVRADLKVGTLASPLGNRDTRLPCRGR